MVLVLSHTDISDALSMISTDAMIDAVEAAIEAVQPLADNRHIELTSDLSGEVGVVRVDPDRIQQVVRDRRTVDGQERPRHQHDRESVSKCDRKR